MKFVPEILDKHIEKEIRRFIDATGKDTWKKKIAKLEDLPKFPRPSPNIYLSYLGIRNPLVAAIKTYYDLDRNGQLIRKHLTPDLMKACGHIKTINEILRGSTEGAAKKILATIVDDATVRSFLFELDLAINFFGRGYDVQFIDLENKGNYDLLVSDEKYELEIECKTKSADAGRKITRGGFYLMCDVLVARLASLKQRIAVLITINGRLGARQDLFERLAEETKHCLTLDRDSGQIENLTFKVIKLPADLRVRNDEEAAVALAPHWSANGHYFVFSNGFTLVVGCESSEKDRVLKAIFEELKHGAEQLSKNRPALLACFLEDIYDEDWSQLTGNSGLSNMTYQILTSPKRSHVNFITYSSQHTRPKRQGAVTSLSATNLRFDNPKPKNPIPITFLKLHS